MELEDVSLQALKQDAHILISSVMAFVLVTVHQELTQIHKIEYAKVVLQIALVVLPTPSVMLVMPDMISIKVSVLQLLLLAQ